MQEIKITRAEQRKEKPDSSKLVFGKYMTDHMFVVDYDEGQGWHDARIVPYAPLQIDPAAKVLHYAQEIFEGLKAYRTADGSIQLFRPMDNVRRLNLSCERIALPEVPEDLALAGITELVKLDQEWVPYEKDTSLYIRPFVIGLDPTLGVHTSHHCQYIVIVCPVGAYYPEGLAPTKIYVKPVLAVMEQVTVKGVSHITGGGFYENIPRSLKKGCAARIAKADVRTPALFEVMQREGGITEHDMFNTFNMGVGMVLTVAAEDADKTIEILQANGQDAYRLGTIVEGDGVELV